MRQLEFAVLTHAKKDRQVFLVPAQVFYVEEDDRDKSTHIISPYGAILPVKETVEAVKSEIKRALGGTKVNE